MNDQPVNVTPADENQFWLSFGYIKDEMVYCPMCEDTHENNTNCQRNDFYV